MKISRHKIKLARLVEDWNTSARILYIFTLSGLFFYKFLPVKRQDGWRKTTEVHHRTDEAKYIGSMHNLALEVNEADDDASMHKAIIDRLYHVFANISDLHFTLRWKQNACMRVPDKYTDFIELSFLQDGSINELFFYPDKRHPISIEVDSILIALKDAYNNTRILNDKIRSLRMLRVLKSKTARIGSAASQSMDVVMRMLSATWISFSSVDDKSEDRMTPHFFHHQKNAGFSLLNTHCKISNDSKWFDIWLQFSHIGIDGRAASKIQSKVQHSFGTYDHQLHFPQDFTFKEEHHIYKYPERAVYHGCSFVDMKSVMVLKDKLYDKLGHVLPVSLIIWGLAQDPAFKGMKFNIPVDIPSAEEMDRTVGFVFIKPASFLSKYPPGRAFMEYNQSIMDQIKGIRKRQNENYYFLQSAVMATPRILISMLKYLSSGLYAFTGKTCVTFMDNIEYAIPSLSDNVESIIAFSMMHHHNNFLACVSLRSKNDDALQMLEAVSNVASNIDEYVETNNDL